MLYNQYDRDKNFYFIFSDEKKEEKLFNLFKVFLLSLQIKDLK